MDEREVGAVFSKIVIVPMRKSTFEDASTTLSSIFRSPFISPLCLSQ